jgi:hypothetical protein
MNKYLEIVYVLGQINNTCSRIVGDCVYLLVEDPAEKKYLIGNIIGNLDRVNEDIEIIKNALDVILEHSQKQDG